MNLNLNINVGGHCKITDDLGIVLLNKTNAIHPENMARVLGRAMANEFNYVINRMAFGNGGTEVDAAFTITYNTPNDGQPPDVNTWDSRIYHEIYSEIVNAGNTVLNPLLGTDPGSADANTGSRPGGGAVPSGDPSTILHVSGPGVVSIENGLTTNVVVTCVLNAQEPSGQYLTDVLGPTQTTNGDFAFDEIGLYTTGLQAIASVGYQYVNVGNVQATDVSGLIAGHTYNFGIVINGGILQPISFTVPNAGGSGSGGQVLYGDIVKALVTGQSTWNITVNGSPVIGVPFLGTTATIAVTNNGTFDPSVAAAETYGFLSFLSGTPGPTSSILLSSGSSNDFFAALNTPTGGSLQPPVQGTSAGVQNAAAAPSFGTTERERLLAHLIFSPILKSANRTLTIVYTLTISVARTT